jgi:hypothetical protein
MAHGAYPKWKGHLWDWALNGPPVGVSLRLALCDDTFAYNAAHETLDDIAGIVYDDFEVTNLLASATGKLSGDTVVCEGMVANDIFSAMVLYWKFTGGTILFQYTTESPAAALPIELIATGLQVRWSVTEGIYQL